MGTAFIPTVHTHNNDRDLYFLSFAEENSKCIGNASIILSKNCIKRTRFYPALLLTRKDSLTLTVLSPNSFPSLTLFQPTHATTGKWLHYRGSRFPEIPPLWKTELASARILLGSDGLDIAQRQQHNKAAQHTLCRYPHDWGFEGARDWQFKHNK